MTLKELVKQVNKECKTDLTLSLKERKKIYADAVEYLTFPKQAKFGKTFYKLLVEKMVENYKLLANSTSKN